MKTLVLYDSIFGNTEKVARAIGAALEAEVCSVNEAKPERLNGLECLIAGSPTRAFRPTSAASGFLKALPAGSLAGVKVAAFDTRAELEKAPAILRFMAGIFGFAAAPLARSLVKKGGKQAVPPEGFIVLDTEGPLKEGELERAAAWARTVLEA